MAFINEPIPVLPIPYVSADFENNRVSAVGLIVNAYLDEKDHKQTFVYFDENLICQVHKLTKQEMNAMPSPLYTYGLFRANTINRPSVEYVNGVAVDRSILLKAGKYLKESQTFNDFIELYNTQIKNDSEKNSRFKKYSNGTRYTSDKKAYRQYIEKSSWDIEKRKPYVTESGRKLTLLDKIMMYVNAPFKAYQFVTKIEPPSVHRNPENKNPKTFDYISIKIHTLRTSAIEQEDTFDEYKDVIVQACMEQIKYAITPVRYHTSINCLSLAEYTMTDDNQIMLVFEPNRRNKPKQEPKPAPAPVKKMEKYEDEIIAVPHLDNPHIDTEQGPSIPEKQIPVRGLVIKRDNDRDQSIAHMLYIDADNTVKKFHTELPIKATKYRNKGLMYPLPLHVDYRHKIHHVNGIKIDTGVLQEVCENIEPGQTLDDIIDRYNTLLVDKKAKMATMQEEQRKQRDEANQRRQTKILENKNISKSDLTRTTKLLLDLDVPLEVHQTITRIEKPSVYRDFNNPNKKTFDFIKIEFCIRKQNRDVTRRILREHKKHFMNIISHMLKKSPDFKKYGIPINFLCISECVITRDDRIVFTLELKKSITELEETP